MRTAFITVTGLAVLIIAYGYPFVAMLRGKRLLRTVGIAWGVLVIYMVSLCFLLPMAVNTFNRKLAKEMWQSWVPEGPSVVGVAVGGWIAPLMAGAIALTVVRPLLARFWPAMLKRIEVVEKKGDCAE